jgi:hypothetical protein
MFQTMKYIALGLLVAGCTVPSIDDAADAGADPADELGELGAEARCVPAGNPYSCRPSTDDANAPRISGPGGSIYWALGAPTKLYDGFGHARANVTDSHGVKINYGMRKAINGLSMVYAWSAGTDEGAASGWILESSIARADLLRQRMPTIAMPYPATGFYETQWIITGGNPAAYGDMKVQANYTGGGRAVTDYLKRGGDVVNIAFNVPGNAIGGFNTDTVPIGTTFRRAKGVLQVDQPYYRPGESTVRGHLQFVYGGFHDGAQMRFGWIPKQALAQAGTVGPIAPDPAQPSAPDVNETATAGTWAGWATCGVRCCDNSLSTFVTHGQGECRASYDICGMHGKTSRMRYDGTLIYERASSCD